MIVSVSCTKWAANSKPLPKTPPSFFDWRVMNTYITIPLLVLVTFLILFSAAKPAAAQSFDRMDGSQLRRIMILEDRAQAHDSTLTLVEQHEVAMLDGYVLGIVDIYNLVGACKGNQTLRADLQALSNYLTAHPDKWDNSWPVLIMAATKEAFPCGNDKAGAK